MPSHPHTEEEFNVVKEGVMKSAPPNMDEATFNKWAGPQFAAAIEQAETLKGASRGKSIKESMEQIISEGAPKAAAYYASPLLKTAIDELATNPAVAKVGGMIGSGIGAVTSLPASFGGFGSIARGSYQGSRAGWFTAKLAQRAAANVSKLTDAIGGTTGVSHIIGPAMGAISAEGDALSQYNTPEALAQLKKMTDKR
jgi:hypothetical protein